MPSPPPGRKYQVSITLLLSLRLPPHYTVHNGEFYLSALGNPLYTSNRLSPSPRLEALSGPLSNPRPESDWTLPVGTSESTPDSAVEHTSSNNRSQTHTASHSEASIVHPVAPDWLARSPARLHSLPSTRTGKPFNPLRRLANGWTLPLSEYWTPPPHTPQPCHAAQSFPS